MDGQERQLIGSVGALKPTRRAFLLMGAGVVLTGCGEKAVTTSLPGPVWKPRDLPPEQVPLPPPTPAPAISGPPGLLARSKWAGGDPSPALMDRMSAIRWVTVHHDGMDPFYATDEGSSRARLESIRRSHRENGWGDIGYHYIVDRQGRLWEGRPINWQGAHVKDCNPGNIGVMCMGNFDKQSPSQAQLATLNRHVGWLMKRYRVHLAHLRTHQEWPSAATACPGLNLQRYMVAVRNSRQIGAA